MRFFIGVRRSTSYYANEMRIFGVGAVAEPVAGAEVWRFYWGIQKIPGSEEPGIGGAPEGIRTPNLLIRSQMLYPLSYERWCSAIVGEHSRPLKTVSRPD